VRLAVDAIRDCLDGAVPGVIATCDVDGTPNVSYLSQVNFVDAEHVALSFQFFNKTRRNVLANPRATVMVVDPTTAAIYRLAVAYVRTETAGPLFESMKAKLAGIASHTGMSGVFRLLGADVYRVLELEAVSCATLPAPVARRNLLGALRAIGQRLAPCNDLAGLLDEALSGLESLFDIHHAMILMADAPGQRVYTVASRGYDASGIGSEIRFGDGVIGVAARERTPIRITHMTTEYAYGRAIRESAAADGYAAMLETEIPLPGLPASRSQLAVPIQAATRLVGILYVESPEDQRFGYDDEDALVAVGGMLGLAINTLHQTTESPDETTAAATGAMAVVGAPQTIRHYGADSSIFLGDDYLIKGVAGAIFWKLLNDYARDQRTDFTNRELRLDPALRLPDISDNLEARLILLQRRLSERTTFVRIEKTGRGRFRLCVGRPVQLQDMPSAAGR
jgi:adenylate cyclase